MTVWKYSLNVTDLQTLKMPIGAEMLHVNLQGGALCLWAKVDPSRSITDRRIRIIGTGHDVENLPLVYIGTVLAAGGQLVWHVFEQP